MLRVMEVSVGDDLVQRIKALARKNLPLGEMALRLDMDLCDVRAIADQNGIAIVRDNRTGGPRQKLAHKVSAASYVATLREGFLARQQHSRRLSLAPPLSPQQEAEAIARFLETKGVTKCPTVHLEASENAFQPGGNSSRTGRAPSRRSP